MPARETNWKAESARAAEYVAEQNSSEDSVGAMRWGPPGIVALYGQMGKSNAQHARALNCIAVARSLLANANVEVLAAAFDRQRRAWSILAESDAIDLLDALVLEAWQIAECMEAY
jgi:hypothetical protein